MDKNKPGIIKKAQGSEWRTVGKEALILKAQTARFYRLNETATVVWKSINGKRKEEDILRIVLDKFKVKKGRAGKDLKTLLGLLRKNKLICTLRR